VWYPKVDTDVLTQMLKYWDLIVLSIALVLLVILGIWGIIRVKRWGQHDEQTFLSPEEEIAAYRRLLEQGVLSQEEFDRVRARLEQPSLRPDPSPSPEPPASEPKM